MKGISGTVYIVIGLFMTLASLIIDKQKLLLFAIIGGIMVIIGIVKVLTSPKEKKQQQIPKSKQPARHPQQNGPLAPRRCKYCGYMARPTDKYCGNCSLLLITVRPSLEN